MSKPFQVPAILEGLSMLKDGGISLRFHTNEMTAEEKVEASKYYQKFGWLLFSENEDIEIPKGRAPESELGKTPSQRLRAVIYIKYQQSDMLDITFDEFYRRELERLINYEKGFLK
jgi:hypothetical protein